MSSQHSNQCRTCAHSRLRYQGIRRILICERFQRPANQDGCVHHNTVKTAITKALDYLKIGR